MAKKKQTTYRVNGVLPDPFDARDYQFKASVATLSTLPKEVDLRKSAGAIENQLTLGSCVANAACSALEIILEKGGKFRDLSRLFLYYNVREPYSDLKEKDTGAYLMEAFKQVNKQGICDETTWTYNTGLVNTKPDEKSYSEAIKHVATRYERINGVNYMAYAQGDTSGRNLIKAALAKGFPVIFSCTVSNSIFGIKGPLETHKYMFNALESAGGHAMTIVGFSDALDGFIVENSWGTEWGDCHIAAIDALRSI